MGNNVSVLAILVKYNLYKTIYFNQYLKDSIEVFYKCFNLYME